MSYIVNDDFEGNAPNTSPAGWGTYVGFSSTDNPAGGASALVDTTRAHSGTKSVLFKTPGAQPTQITKALPPGLTTVYMRAWVYNTSTIGGHDINAYNHEHIFALRQSVGSEGTEFRFGQSKGTVGANIVPSDALSPNVFGGGFNAATQPTIPANVWNCIELGLLGGRPQNVVIASLNGKEVFRIDSPDDWHAATPGNFLDGYFKEVVFGFRSFTNGVNGNIWMDDIRVSTSPIGCSNTESSTSSSKSSTSSYGSSSSSFSGNSGGASSSSSSPSTSSSSSTSSASGTSLVNLLSSDGTFTGGKGLFTDHIGTIGDSISFVNGVVGVSMPVASTALWHVQLTHPVELTAGVTHSACFDAIAVADRSIRIDFDDGGPIYASLADGLLASITTTWKSYKYTFTAQTTDATARLAFNMGMLAAPVNMQLDNIGVYQGGACPASSGGSSSSAGGVSGAELITNGTFDAVMSP